MGELAVLAERFAVVGGDHDQRRAAAGRAGGFEERSERVVGVGHLAVIGTGRIARVERRRRTVDRVRVEQVHPREPAVGLRFDPGARGGDHRLGRALGNREVGRAFRKAEAVIVDIEAVVEPELAVEREGGDEGAGGEPLGPETASQGRAVVPEA